MYNLTLPKIGKHYAYEGIKAYFTMTEQGVSILTTRNGTCLYYLSTICLSKNITLIANEPLDFPIEEFIIPGYDPINFSFQEISENLII